MVLNGNYYLFMDLAFDLKDGWAFKWNANTATTSFSCTSIIFLKK